jgi:hypothetical protein
MNVSAAGGGEEAPSGSDQQEPPGSTRHFEERRARGDRPTGQALADVRNVAPSNLLVDDETGLFIVQGPRGRIHVFLQDGARHTSFRNTRANTQRRVNTGRWRPATPEEFQQFQGFVQL